MDVSIELPEISAAPAEDKENQLPKNTITKSNAAKKPAVKRKEPFQAPKDKTSRTKPDDPAAKKRRLNSGTAASTPTPTTFKARPLNRKIFDSIGQLGVPRVEKKPPTEVKEFSLSSGRKTTKKETPAPSLEQVKPVTPGRITPRPATVKTAAAGASTPEQVQKCMSVSNYLAAFNHLRKLSGEQINKEVSAIHLTKMMTQFTKMKMEARLQDLIELIVDKLERFDSESELYKSLKMIMDTKAESNKNYNTLLGILQTKTILPSAAEKSESVVIAASQ